jgi:uncharacterized protein YxjI
MGCMPYLVQERIFSSAGSFSVTDEQGNLVYVISGQIMGQSQTFDLQDKSGAILVSLRKERFTSRDTMDIQRDGAVIATVQPAVFSPVHHRSVIRLAAGGELEAIGNFLGREFEIRSGDKVLAKISRSLFQFHDRYAVDVSPGQDDALMLAIAISMDRIEADEDAEIKAAEREHRTFSPPPPGR